MEKENMVQDESSSQEYEGEGQYSEEEVDRIRRRISVTMMIAKPQSATKPYIASMHQNMASLNASHMCTFVLSVRGLIIKDERYPARGHTRGLHLVCSAECACR